MTVNARDKYWRVLKATPDSSVSLSGFVVADRDRFEVEFSEPVETITVKLLAGTSARILLRIRRPE